MGKLEDWQPLFRFLDKVNKSEFVGLAFALAYLIGVVVGWYWICFKGGAGMWGDKLISLNKRFGISTWYIRPLILKVFATVFLFGSIFMLFLALLSYINRQ